MKNFTNHERAAMARAWLASGLTQAVFAARHGISDRTLRSWTRRFTSRQPPLERVRAVVRDAVEQLQAVLASLNKEALAGCRAQLQDSEPGARNAEGASRPASEKPACRAECRSEGAAPATNGPPPSPERPRRPDPSGAAGRADLDDSPARARTEVSRLGVTAAPLAPPVQSPLVSSQRRPRRGGFFANWGSGDEGA